MVKIKICGLSRPEDIEYVNDACPDFCGFIIQVPASRRNVTVEQLRRLRESLSERIRAVGVFVNADPALPEALLKEGVIDIAQLHGQEDEAYRAAQREDREICDQGVFCFGAGRSGAGVLKLRRHGAA